MKLKYLVIPISFLLLCVYNWIYPVDLQGFHTSVHFLFFVLVSLFFAQALYHFHMLFESFEEDGKPRCKHCGHVLEE